MFALLVERGIPGAGDTVELELDLDELVEVVGAVEDRSRLIGDPGRPSEYERAAPATHSARPLISSSACAMCAVGERRTTRLRVPLNERTGANTRVGRVEHERCGGAWACFEGTFKNEKHARGRARTSAPERLATRAEIREPRTALLNDCTAQRI